MGIIQIIDDEPYHARLLDLALRRARYQTNTAHDGWIGLADVQRLRPALVLLDVMLPGLDGYELCRRLKADLQTQSLPVIMLSALGTEDHRLKGFKLGVDDYVTKPFSSKEVVPGSRRCCDAPVRRPFDRRPIWTGWSGWRPADSRCPFRDRA